MNKYTILFDNLKAQVIAENEAEARIEAVRMMGIIFTPSKNNPCTSDCVAHASISKVEEIP